MPLRWWLFSSPISFPLWFNVITYICFGWNDVETALIQPLCVEWVVTTAYGKSQQGQCILWVNWALIWTLVVCIQFEISFCELTLLSSSSIRGTVKHWSGPWHSVCFPFDFSLLILFTLLSLSLSSFPSLAHHLDVLCVCLTTMETVSGLLLLPMKEISSVAMKLWV